MFVLLCRSCVGFIPLVLPETLHAIMRLLLRLTRSLKNAIIFSRLGGTQNLLNLTEESGFIGFLPLANLLIRHAVEDHNCLRFAMEKVILNFLLEYYRLLRFVL